MLEENPRKFPSTRNVPKKSPSLFSSVQSSPSHLYRYRSPTRTLPHTVQRTKAWKKRGTRVRKFNRLLYSTRDFAHQQQRAQQQRTQQQSGVGTMSALPVNQKYPGEAPPPYYQQQAAVPGQDMARCKGCGRQFVRKPGENPASAQWHRCEKCNKRQTRDMLLVNATCGASSLCSIQ